MSKEEENKMYEELYLELQNDPEYIKYQEQKLQEWSEYLDSQIESIKNKVDREIDPYEQSHLI